MVKKDFDHIILLAKRLGIILLLYTFCRILFFVFNLGHFEQVGLSEFTAGILFDFSAIVYVNLLFITLSLLPFPFRERKGYQRILKWSFYVPNLAALVLNLVDIAYFKFTLKRSTSDLISLVGYGNDVQQLVPTFIRDYWYLILMAIGMVVIIEFLWRQIKPRFTKQPFHFGYLLRHTVLFGVSAGFFILMSRGGLQVKPISIIDAGKFTETQNMPLVLNSPFTMILSMSSKGLEQRNDYREEELLSIYNPIRQYHPPAAGSDKKKLNVVVLILESFSKEYIGFYGNEKGYTPFLDSLMQHSLVYDRAYANGLTSIQGVPSITSGLLSLMQQPYISSPFSGNNITTLASVLNDEGYQTAFYHGATNGSMRFDGFCKAAGFRHYIGRTEYNNNAHFDGQWGIWDEEFLQYFSGSLSHTKTPFLGMAFTINSHHPFVIPKKYEGRFKTGNIPMLRAVGYTDYALKRFFQTASQQPWYNRTLFVITADHTGPISQPAARTAKEVYAVPLIFYRPTGELKGRDSMIANQIDILPTVLDYIGYRKPFIAFGESLFSFPEKDRYSVSYKNGIYQLIGDTHVLQYNGSEAVAFFRVKTDPLLKKNLLSEKNGGNMSRSDQRVKASMLRYLKAVIQTYNHRMSANKLRIK